MDFSSLNLKQLAMIQKQLTSAKEAARKRDADGRKELEAMEIALTAAKARLEGKCNKNSEVVTKRRKELNEELAAIISGEHPVCYAGFEEEAQEYFDMKEAIAAKKKALGPAPRIRDRKKRRAAASPAPQHPHTGGKRPRCAQPPPVFVDEDSEYSEEEIGAGGIVDLGPGTPQ